MSEYRSVNLPINIVGSETRDELLKGEDDKKPDKRLNASQRVQSWLSKLGLKTPTVKTTPKIPIGFTIANFAEGLESRVINTWADILNGDSPATPSNRGEARAAFNQNEENPRSSSLPNLDRRRANDNLGAYDESILNIMKGSDSTTSPGNTGRALVPPKEDTPTISEYKSKFEFDYESDPSKFTIPGQAKERVKRSDPEYDVYKDTRMMGAREKAQYRIKEVARRRREKKAFDDISSVEFKETDYMKPPEDNDAITFLKDPFSKKLDI